jgi:hypothetical protein
MNNSFLKRVILLLSTVFFIFSLSACKTMKAAVSFKWGKRIESEHQLEARKALKEYPSTSYANEWIYTGSLQKNLFKI